jgi:hypothetical protein
MEYSAAVFRCLIRPWTRVAGKGIVEGHEGLVHRGMGGDAQVTPTELRLGSPLEHRLTPIIDTCRAPLRAACHERRKQIGEHGVPTVLPRQPLHVVPLASPARFADHRQDRDTDIGQDVCAIAGHDGGQSTGERSGNARAL